MPRNLATCPHCHGDLQGQLDGRAGWWLFRVRLYDMHVDPDEPIADSDSGLSPDKPGATQVRGLWKVLSEAAAGASDFHNGATLRGWSAEDQERKLRGIRPTLSRNGGRASLRVQYDTEASVTDARDHTPRYLARVDILKTNGSDT
jgi:hypothetical protein